MSGLLELLQAFSNLISPVIEFAIWVWPLKISWLHDGQKGVICTFGRVRNWRWPMADRGPGLVIYGTCEELYFSQASGVMADLVEQTVCFSDGRVAILNGSVVFGIADCRAALLQTHDNVPIVKQASMNALRRWAADQPPTCITESEDITAEVAPLVNPELACYGCRVDRVFVSELRPDHVQMACDAAKTCAEMLTPKG